MHLVSLSLSLSDILQVSDSRVQQKQQCVCAAVHCAVRGMHSNVNKPWDDAKPNRELRLNLQFGDSTTLWNKSKILASSECRDWG